MRFFFSDCGHLVGCDDPTFDLTAEVTRRRKAEFEHDMTRAIETGEAYWRRSSSPLSGHIQELICAVAHDPSPQNIWRAQWAFDEQEEWHAFWDNRPSEPDCGCPTEHNEDDPEDVHLEQIHVPDCKA